MTTKTLTPLQHNAFTWADKQSEINHLNEILGKSDLNSEQENYIYDYLNHATENLIDLESYIIEGNEDDENYYLKVRQVADMIEVKPSEDFLSNLNKYLSEMDLDGIEFQIQDAVEKFNRFYYGCSIVLNSHGYVSFHGCESESNASSTVLFNKSEKRTLTIEDVKFKIQKLNR